jgi:hypothetical protein
MATHGSTKEFTQTHSGHNLLGIVLYLMCDDLHSTIAVLKATNIRLTEIEKKEFGLKTTITLPSGGEIGLYQPSHLTALEPQSGH